VLGIYKDQPPKQNNNTTPPHQNAMHKSSLPFIQYKIANANLFILFFFTCFLFFSFSLFFPLLVFSPQLMELKSFSVCPGLFFRGMNIQKRRNPWKKPTKELPK
jgi:hypothetical protein